MAPWFPVVGALVGRRRRRRRRRAAALAPADWPRRRWPLLLGVLVTGAFHEDGLADLADAIAGGSTRERRFEILEDPRHGTLRRRRAVPLRSWCVSRRSPRCCRRPGGHVRRARRRPCARPGAWRSAAIGVRAGRVARRARCRRSPFRSRREARAAATVVIARCASARVATGWWAGAGWPASPSAAAAVAVGRRGSHARRRHRRRRSAPSSRSPRSLPCSWRAPSPPATLWWR